MNQGISIDLEDASKDLVAVADTSAPRQLKELDEAIGRLPIEQRQVILLVGLEGMDLNNPTGPGMPAIENFALFRDHRPVGVTAPRCITRSGRTARSVTKCLRCFTGRPATPARRPSDEAEFSSLGWSKVGGKLKWALRLYLHLDENKGSGHRQDKMDRGFCARIGGDRR